MVNSSEKVFFFFKTSYLVDRENTENESFTTKEHLKPEFDPGDDEYMGQDPNWRLIFLLQQLTTYQTPNILSTDTSVEIYKNVIKLVDESKTRL